LEAKQTKEIGTAYENHILPPAFVGSFLPTLVVYTQLSRKAPTPLSNQSHRGLGVCLPSRRLSYSGSAMFPGPQRSAAHVDPAFPAHRLDQDVCRNAEFVMQIANHIQRQRTISSHHFVHTGALADHTNQGAKVLPLLFQSKLDGLNRIGKVYWVARSLVCLD
jgi:hypothetical protein